MSTFQSRNDAAFSGFSKWSGSARANHKPVAVYGLAGFIDGGGYCGDVAAMMIAEDWECKFCGSLVDPQSRKCPNCGASKQRQ